MAPKPPPKPSLPLKQRFGPFYLDRMIAVGGMAEIYLAQTRGLAGFEKQLVLKAIHSDLASDSKFVDMLVAEAKLAVTLNHANIVQTFDLGRIANTYYISMEYVDGADYFQILKGLTAQKRELPIEAALFVVAEACEGLEYAHNKHDARDRPLELIHRDVSPQNMLLSRHGEVKVADFGIAKVANVSSQTKAGVIKGKIVYMSPEQAWGEAIDRRSDLFSAGVVLYEALTGGSLYLEDNPVKLLHQVRKAEIPPPSTIRGEIDAELDAIVAKAIAKRPEDRFQTAAELGSALRAYLRRLSPKYSAQRLATLVQSVVGEGGAATGKKAKRRPTMQDLEPMARNDVSSLSEHSLIFSPEDLHSDELSAAGKASRGDSPQGSDAPRGRLELADEDGPKTFEISREFLIGRGGDVRLTDGRVSRRHARILVRDGRYVLEDLKSSNGTYLNERRLEVPHELRSGDAIEIGPYKMRFTLDAEAKPSPVGAEAGELAAPAAPAGSPKRPRGAQARQASSRSPDVEPAAAVGSRAIVTMTFGSETMRVAVGESLPLEQRLAVEDLDLEGVAGTIKRRVDGYWLEPAAERRTVLINGVAVAGARLLISGDQLQVGPLRLRFELEDESAV